MADILNRCLKCKCSLSAIDKISKLLPCLHTMCEDCISGRTDVAEKIKRLKEEKELKAAQAAAATTDVKDETGKCDNDTTQGSEKIEKDSEDGTNDAKPNEVTDEKTEQTEGAPDAERKSPVPDKTDLVPEKNEDKKDVEEETEMDVDNTGPAGEGKEPTAVNSTTSSEVPISSNGEDDVAKSTGSEKESEAKPNCEPTEVQSAMESDVKGGSESDVQGAIESDSADNQNAKEGQDVDNKTEEKRPPIDEEVEEIIPPEPVPLTECPTCREPFNHETLIENVFIRKQAVTSEGGEGNQQKCTGCESNPATSYCLQCDDWLCGDCVTAHKRVRMTKDHQLTSVEEAIANKAEKTTPTEVSMMCSVHPKEKLTLFCEKCEMLTCRDCQLQQHQEHKYQFLREAADSYKAKLTGSLSLMKDRCEVLKRYQTEIEERLSKVKREKNDLQQDILRQADTIVKAVRAAVWSVLSSLHSFTDAAAKRLSREVNDVGALVGKFEHCISFMGGILEDGLGLPLLFSKTIVETKCRKVYHTPMEPQSLKGQLNIQYRHEVPNVLRSLPHIGAIFVNGCKYPPEKSTSQSQSQPPNASSSHNSSAYRGGNPVQGSVGGAGQSQVASHMPPQAERNLYMQMMMNRQSHANTAVSQGSTLSLPGSRRLGSMGPGGPRGWPTQQLGLVGSQGSLMPGMMSHSQQMMAARPPTFTPMRLHHRPVDPSHMSSASAMVLGGPPRPSHSSHPGSFNSLPAPPPLRSPSQYRGAADGMLLNSGGQAAMSGIRRQGNLMDTSPDPARPASGGHNTPERPLSSEGAASSMRVKSEPMDNSDCIITSATFKGKKSSVMPSSSLGELQKNLDEVIRGVPLDLGDNLEQISGGDCSGVGSSVKTTLPPPPLVPSPVGTVASSVTSSSSSSSSTINKSNEQSSVSSTSATATTATRAGDKESVAETTVSANGMQQQSADPEVDGRQVEGYATGNSMPGFTLSAVESSDPNDDYCAACHQGGDVLCCDKCPRVFHLQCHVPVLSVVPNGTFICTLCESDLIMDGLEDRMMADIALKRKAPSGLSDQNLKVCERLLLELFCHSSSIPFHEPVNRTVPNYYKIITNPMDFSTIKCKLSRSHFNHYSSMEAFLDDCKLVFKNCAIYNAETSEVGKAGKIVEIFFKKLVDQHMPFYGTYAHCHQESLDSEVKEPEAKKAR